MKDLFSVSSCASTNDEILQYLSENQPEIIGLYTLNQTKGRGQYGNSWMQNAGQNLAFSVAVPASFIPSDTFINFRTATLLRHFVAKLTDEDTKIKWPNDLILLQKKISGILIEKKKVHQHLFYIIGIGLNINQTDFDLLPKAGSLFSQTGKTHIPKDVAEALFTLLKTEFPKPVDFQMVLNEFNQHLFRKDQISVLEKNKIRQNGILRNVDEDGFLWIEMEQDGLQKFFHKEIELLY